MKSLWVIILLVIIAAAGYWAYTQNLFAPTNDTANGAGAGLDLSVDGTSGFGEE